MLFGCRLALDAQEVLDKELIEALVTEPTPGDGVHVKAPGLEFTAFSRE